MGKKSKRREDEEQAEEQKDTAGRVKKKAYEKALKGLNVELVKLQEWVKSTGHRMVVIFEGRDAAGKGGAIKSISQSMSARVCRVVALAAPSDREKTQWYFQRYVPHLPAAGSIVLFDRSWYNRAGVERVMGFCSPDQLADLLREAPQFEGMLTRDGIHLFKFYLDIGRQMQLKRFQRRRHDPLRPGK